MKESSLRCSVLLCASAVILSFCGCAVGSPLALSDEVQLQKAHQVRPKGLDYSVAVAPVLVYPVRTPANKERWSLRVKATDLQKEITATLREVPVFASVEQTPSSDPAAAREKGAQLLLKVALSNCTASFGGTNGYFIPNMLVWGILSPIASTFVADEFYSVAGSVTAELVDTSSGSPVWSRAITLQEKYNLNDWQRGPTVWDFFFIAPFYTSWTPQKVDSVILPHVMHKIKVQLAENILKDLPPPKRSFAIVVGVNSCGLPGAPELQFAQRDAASLAELLSKHGFDDVTLLIGEQATRSKIESKLTEVAARSDVLVENFVVYFAGLGTTKFDSATTTCTQSLLTRGMTVEDCELGLVKLLKMVQSIPAASRVVVIDAGFSGESGRTYPVERIPAATVREYPAVLKNTYDISFLLASEAGETAYEFEKLRSGVFTHFLLRGLAGKADLNSDKVITVQEALKTAAWPVTRYVRSNRPGQSQKPCMLGKNAASRKVLKLK